MDTKKWKSVLVPRDIYEEIVTIARVEGRTISGLFRVVFDTWKSEKFTKKRLKNEKTNFVANGLTRLFQGKSKKYERRGQRGSYCTVWPSDVEDQAATGLDCADEQALRFSD